MFTCLSSCLTLSSFSNGTCSLQLLTTLSLLSFLLSSFLFLFFLFPFFSLSLLLFLETEIPTTAIRAGVSSGRRHSYQESGGGNRNRKDPFKDQDSKTSSSSSSSSLSIHRGRNVHRKETSSFSPSKSSHSLDGLSFADSSSSSSFPSSSSSSLHFSPSSSFLHLSSPSFLHLSSPSFLHFSPFTFSSSIHCCSTTMILMTRLSQQIIALLTSSFNLLTIFCLFLSSFHSLPSSFSLPSFSSIFLSFLPLPSFSPIEKSLQLFSSPFLLLSSITSFISSFSSISFRWFSSFSSISFRWFSSLVNQILIIILPSRKSFLSFPSMTIQWYHPFHTTNSNTRKLCIPMSDQ